MKSFDPNPLYSDAYYLLTNSRQRSINVNNTDYRTRNGRYMRLCSNNSLVARNYRRLLMNYTGNMQYYKQWVLDWQEPKDNCGIYGMCGKFGVCNESNSVQCSCLDGFEPIAQGDQSAGCKRTSSDICGKNDQVLNVSLIKLENPTLPSIKLANESECQEKCLQSCSCQAYSYSDANSQHGSSGRVGGTNNCWIWESELNNLQTEGTNNISVRISSAITVQGPDLKQAKGSSFLTATHILIFTMAILVILFVCSLSYIYYRRLVTREQGRNSELETENNERWAIDLLDLDNHSRQQGDIEGIGIPFFHFESIQVATDNFQMLISLDKEVLDRSIRS